MAAAARTAADQAARAAASAVETAEVAAAAAVPVRAAAAEVANSACSNRSTGRILEGRRPPRSEAARPCHRMWSRRRVKRSSLMAERTAEGEERRVGAMEEERAAAGAGVVMAGLGETVDDEGAAVAVLALETTAAAPMAQAAAAAMALASTTAEAAKVLVAKERVAADGPAMAVGWAMAAEGAAEVAVATVAARAALLAAAVEAEERCIHLAVHGECTLWVAGHCIPRRRTEHGRPLDVTDEADERACMLCICTVHPLS